MIKLYSRVCLLLMFPLLATAKSTSISVPNIFPHYGSNHAVVFPGLTSRIIAKAYHKYTGGAFVPVDSTTYSYLSNARGGQLSKEDMSDNFVRFDTSIIYGYSAAAGGYFQKLRRSQSFTSGHNTTWYYVQPWKTSVSGWKDSSKLRYLYDNDEVRLDSTIQFGWVGVWNEQTRYRNQYDAAGNLISTGTVTYQWVYTYDAANRVTQRVEKHRWLLNNDFTPWIEKNRHTFTYNNAGQIIAYLEERFDNGWVNETLTENDYTGNTVSTSRIFKWVNNSWVPKERHFYTYSLTDNVLSDELQTWNAVAGSFVPVSLEQWTYNSFSQPVSYYSQTWNSSGNTWEFGDGDFLYNYYYQNYNPAGIGTPGADFASLVVYPQPARDVLNVHIETKTTAPLNYSIADAQGRLITQGAIKQGVKNLSIATGSFVPGNYFLILGNAGGKVAERFSVIQ